MTVHSSSCLSRRAFVLSSAAALALPAFSGFPARATAAREYRLVAAPGRAPLVGGGHPETAVWAYNGAVPGPEIRARQGERLRIVVENRLNEETTVHWHGIRLPNAMDGVPHLTQKPIAPGAIFTYEFDLPDAGTYWYHPHQRSFEQVGRGLYGPLIVEERAPITVDREFYWVLDDWRLLKDAQISDDFGNMMDASHNGRIGNTATVNGRIRETFEVRSGERIRLRLINAANARTFALDFAGHAPHVIALDGQPVEPHEPADGRIVLGAATRADVVIDMTGKPGERFTVSDRFYRGLEYRLLDLVYADEPLRGRRREDPIALAPNTMPEPDLNSAERHDVVFGGGMMGGMMAAMMKGRQTDMREMMQHGMAWAINGVAATGHTPEPILTLARGRTCVLAMRNDTAWHHPMHLHGHAFRVISRNGEPTRHREWRDTVLLSPRESAEIAFVADNPGDWMFHCHILEHQAAGMMAVIRIA